MDHAATLLKRMRERCSPALSVRKLASVLEMAPSSYAFYEDANKFKKRYIPVDLAHALVAPFGERGIDPEDVLALAGVGVSAAQPAETDRTRDLDLVPIATIDQEYGMGSAFIADHIEPEIMQFPRAWIEGFTLTPSHMLTFARGRGDSMQPAIMHNDMVLIDRSQRIITEPDAIWAYADGDMGGIKRLRLKGDRIIILSDNPSVPPDEAMLDAINIIGRVIMIIRNV